MNELIDELEKMAEREEKASRHVTGPGFPPPWGQDIIDAHLANAKIIRSALSHLREGSGTGGGEKLSRAAFNAIVATCENPPQPTAKLRELMAGARPVSPSPDKVEEVAKVRELYDCELSDIAEIIADRMEGDCNSDDAEWSITLSAGHWAVPGELHQQDVLPSGGGGGS
jgi:hypothetical protein